MLPEEKITAFIRKHHVLTLATSADGQPWCANMFYAYLREENLFVFTSDDHTRHVAEARINPRVAASITLETKVVGRLQGLQIEGTLRPAGEGETAPRKAFLKRFPYAAVTDLHLWVLEPSLMKLTDNTLGFGKKLIWQKK